MMRGMGLGSCEAAPRELIDLGPTLFLITVPFLTIDHGGCWWMHACMHSFDNNVTWVFYKPFRVDGR